MDDATLTALRAIIGEQLAPLQAQLDAIEHKLDLIPDLRFLHANDIAKTVVKSLRVARELEERSRTVILVPD
jgi:hypothetical protein